uniref:AlNc14C785G12506 protein n=1 Tax=Albugo laibachii Nc14 TaxID=890382 RepID=F0X214_9STRA|nr:AlNc14C785G12506 [Albugo laibachii Nc14]|eukprot:CCA27875.1 AlNc14C785G12506 [Albugo laibachii Nc14]
MKEKLDVIPRVLLTYCDLALSDAIRHVFPKSEAFEIVEEWKDLMKSWNRICRAKTIALYEKEWTYFQKARSRRVSHCGNTSTSAAEGAHAALKRYLQTANGNLDLVMTRMTQADENQARETEVIISKEKIRVPHAFRNAHCLEQLIGRVSVLALRKLDVERDWSFECAETPCSHSFRNFMAMLCAHELLQLGHAFSEEETENTRVVSTEQSSFHIDMKTLENRFPLWSPVQQGIVGSIIKELASGNIPVLKEPATVKTKGRPVETNRRPGESLLPLE